MCKCSWVAFHGQGVEFPQGSARFCQGWGWISAHCVPWQIFSQKTKILQGAGPGSAEPECLFPKILSGFSSARVQVPGEVETLLRVLSLQKSLSKVIPLLLEMLPRSRPKVGPLHPKFLLQKRLQTPPRLHFWSQGLLSLLSPQIFSFFPTQLRLPNLPCAFPSSSRGSVGFSRMEFPSPGATSQLQQFQIHGLSSSLPPVHTNLAEFQPSVPT